MQPEPAQSGSAVGGPTLWLLELPDPLRPELFDRWCAAGLVSEEDLAHASRYGHGGARAQFLGGRALLRHALGMQARIAPGDVHIVRDDLGKPRLARSDWHFNLSHSGDMVACVVAAAPVGVDVESTSRGIDYLAIAEQHFSLEEAHWIAARPSASKNRFTALWTLKEAYLKAVGVGISVPLGGVRFSALKHRSCRIHSADAQRGARWHGRLLRLQHGYWLAVCQEAHMPPLDVRRVAL